ncbi:sigma 54-interacting transcriptional regulator [Treponema sp.]|uniref:sigma-54-dependent Fis family transcriptional regulator n=1 Tax=Treponema sp. TaxID=166 RepID=UPI003890BAE9
MSEQFITLDRLKTLVEKYSVVNSSVSDPDILLNSLLESVKHLVNCEAAYLLLARRETNDFEFGICLGKNNSEVRKQVVDGNSIAGWVARNNKTVIVNDVASDPRFNRKIQEKTQYIIHNLIGFPLTIEGVCFGVIELMNKLDDEEFTEEDIALVDIFGHQASIAYKNAVNLKKSRDQLSLFKNAFEAGKEYHPFIAKNPVIISLIESIKQASAINSSVLITGESGVGKELFAEQVHLLSNRKDKPLVRVSCASLNPTLLESELFGHVKGAYTDAHSDTKGRFETANGGTLFLDEIGELPLNLQAKLLRVLQEKKFERVGSSETICVDVRIIAATNRDLEQMITEGSFRKDLYFRLNVLPIAVPPLRNRRDEIPDLAMYFVNKSETHKGFKGFSEEAKKAMLKYMWPGNIRELENTIERACIFGTPPLIKVEDLRLPMDNPVEETDGNVPSAGGSSYYPKEKVSAMQTAMGEDRTLKSALNQFKKEYLIKILNETGWNQTAAAKILDIQRTYVSKLMTELGIKK